MFYQFTPVWIALILLFSLSIVIKPKLGFYGKLYDSPIGMIGFGLVKFWIFTGIFGFMELIHHTLRPYAGFRDEEKATRNAVARRGRE